MSSVTIFQPDHEHIPNNETLNLNNKLSKERSDLVEIKCIK